MKKILLLTAVAMATLAACKKKDNNEEIVSQVLVADPINEITISSTDFNVTVVDINPDTVLPWAYQTEVHYPLDVNADGTPDFNLNYQNNYGNGSAMVHLSTKISIEASSSDGSVLCDFIYPKRVFHKNTDTLISETPMNEIYPKILSENDVIHKTDNWKTGRFYLLYSYEAYKFDPTKTSQELISTTYEGAWYMTDKKYVGIRYKDKLGWIKIGIDKGKIKIYEYAVSR